MYFRNCSDCQIELESPASCSAFTRFERRAMNTKKLPKNTQAAATNTSPTTSVHSPEPLSQQEIWQRAKFPWKYNTDRSVRQ